MRENLVERLLKNILKRILNKILGKKNIYQKINSENKKKYIKKIINYMDF